MQETAVVFPKAAPSLLVRKLKAEQLLLKSRVKALCETITSFLAFRMAQAPNPPVYMNPTFKLYCKMLNVGVPRGAVLQKLKKDGVAGAIAKIVLDGDHYSPAPAVYAPKPTYRESVVLSRTRPDEHWRLVHRGLRKVRSGNTAGIDLLELNGDYIVKLRRETEIEKSARKEDEELALMQKEDKQVSFIAKARVIVAKRSKVTYTRARHQRALRSRRLAERKRETARQNIIFARRTRLSKLAERLAKESELEYNNMGRNPDSGAVRLRARDDAWRRQRDVDAKLASRQARVVPGRSTMGDGNDKRIRLPSTIKPVKEQSHTLAVKALTGIARPVQGAERMAKLKQKKKGWVRYARVTKFSCGNVIILTVATPHKDSALLHVEIYEPATGRTYFDVVNGDSGYLAERARVLFSLCV